MESKADTRALKYSIYIFSRLPTCRDIITSASVLVGFLSFNCSSNRATELLRDPIVDASLSKILMAGPAPPHGICALGGIYGASPPPRRDLSLYFVLTLQGGGVKDFVLCSPKSNKKKSLKSGGKALFGTEKKNEKALRGDANTARWL